MHLTPRQREVLDLLARGYTNPRVADALGISLDGAKWHVREILDELQVDSREEAAAYWRAQQRLPARLRRLAFGSVFARVAIAAVLALAVAAGIVAAFALQNDGDDTPANPATSPTPTATVTTATPAPSPTASPVPNGEAADGVPIEEFELGPPVDLLETHALYWTWAGTEGPWQNLYRGFRASDGTNVIENLYERLPTHESISGNVFDASTGRIAVLICLRGYCGGYAQAGPDSEAYLTVSMDFGTTWSDPVRMPVGWYPVLFDEVGLVGVVYGDGTQPAPMFTRHPSGDPYPVPSGAHPLALDDGRVVFMMNEPNRPLVDPDGNTLYDPPVTPPAVTQTRPLLADLRWTHWDTQSASYVAERESGLFLRVLRLAQEFGRLAYYAAAGDGKLLGRLDGATSPTRTLDPVLIDLGAARIHPIEGLGEPPGYFVGLLAVAGRFAAAIPGAGECLNIRTDPSLGALVVECVPDGVLLRLEGEPTEASEGGTWIPVAAPSGANGWASAEFLR